MSELGEICDTSETPPREANSFNETKAYQEFTEKFNSYVVDDQAESSLEPGEVVSPTESPVPPPACSSPIIVVKRPEVLGRDVALKRLKAIGMQKKMHDEAKEKKSVKQKKSEAAREKKSRRKSESEKSKDTTVTSVPTEPEVSDVQEDLNSSYETLKFGSSLIYRIRAKAPEPEPTPKSAEVKLSTSLEAIKSYNDEKDKEDPSKTDTKADRDKSQSKKREKYKERSPNRDEGSSSSSFLPNEKGFGRKAPFADGYNQMRFGQSSFYKPRPDFRERHFHPRGRFEGRPVFMPRNGPPARFPMGFAQMGGMMDSQMLPPVHPEEKFRPASYAERERCREEKKMRKRDRRTKSKDSSDVKPIIRWTKTKPPIGFTTILQLQDFRRKKSDEKSKKKDRKESSRERSNSKKAKVPNEKDVDTKEKDKSVIEKTDESKEKKDKKRKKSKDKRDEKKKDRKRSKKSKKKNLSRYESKSNLNEKEDDESIRTSSNTKKSNNKDKHEKESKTINDDKSKEKLEGNKDTKIKTEKAESSVANKKRIEITPKVEKEKILGEVQHNLDKKIKKEENIFDENELEPTVNEKSESPIKKRKKDKINKRSLSFPTDEFTFPDEDKRDQNKAEEFPLVKDESTLPMDPIKTDSKEASPDTDDYMDNWETEVEYSTATSTSAFESSTPIFSQPSEEDVGLPYVNSDDTDMADEEQPDVKELYSPTPLLTMDESTNQSDDTQDGFQASLFMNPSPPSEVVNEISTTPCSTPPIVSQVRSPTTSSPRELLSHQTTHSRFSESPVPKTPKTEEPKKILFEMQDVYNQFMKSVEESGIHLSSDSSHKELSTSLSPNKSLITESTPSPTPSRSSGTSMSSSSSDDESSFSSPSSTIDAESHIAEDASMTNFELFSPTDMEKIKQLQENLSRIRLIRESYDSSDELYDELIKMENMIVLQKNLLIQKYTAAAPSRQFVSTLQQATSPEHDNDTKPNKILNSKRETIKLKISPIKLQKSGALRDYRDDSPELSVAVKVEPEIQVDEEVDFTDKLLKNTKEPCKLKDVVKEEITKSNHHRQHSLEKIKRRPPNSRSNSPSERRRNRDRGRTLSASPPHRRRTHRLSKSPSRRSGIGTSRGEFRRKGHGRSRSRSRSNSLKRSTRHVSPGPSRRRRGDGRKFHGRSRSRSPMVSRKRSRSRSPYNRGFSRSPLPFKPPSPPTRRSLSRSRSISVDRPRSRSRSRGRSPSYYFGSQNSEYFSEVYYNTESPGRLPLDARINMELNNGQMDISANNVASQYSTDPYNNYNTYGYMAMPSVPGVAPPNYTAPYTNQYGQTEAPSSSYENNYSNIPTIGGGNHAPPSNSYYYGDFASPFNAINHNPSVIKELPKAPESTQMTLIEQPAEIPPTTTEFAVQKGNVLEIVPSSNLQQVKLEKRSPEADRADKPESLQRLKSRSWKEEVNNRHITSAVLRLRKENDGSSKSILRTAERQTSPKQKKTVYFQDGIFPNMDSEEEDRRIIQVKLNRKIKKFRRLRGTSNKENMDSDSDSEYDENGRRKPPPPPTGSPPPHLPQPVYNGPEQPRHTYFHYDPVVRSMYISDIEAAIPPRLLAHKAPLPPPIKLNVQSPNPIQSPSSFVQKKEGIKIPTITSDIFSPNASRLNSPLIKPSSTCTSGGGQPNTPDGHRTSPHHPLGQFAQSSPRPPLQSMFGPPRPAHFVRLPPTQLPTAPPNMHFAGYNSELSTMPPNNNQFYRPPFFMPPINRPAMPDNMLPFPPPPHMMNPHIPPPQIQPHPPPPHNMSYPPPNLRTMPHMQNSPMQQLNNPPPVDDGSPGMFSRNGNNGKPRKY